MTREEAIAILKAFMGNPLFSDAHKQAFNIAIHDIKQRHDWDINNLILINKDNYEPLEQEPRWIPVSEKKPNRGGEYLLWGKIDENEEEDYCFIGDYHEFDEVFGTEISNYDPKTLGFIDTEIEEYYSVLAWMPLPKPYSEVKE